MGKIVRELAGVPFCEVSERSCAVRIPVLFGYTHLSERPMTARGLENGVETKTRLVIALFFLNRYLSINPTKKTYLRFRVRRKMSDRRIKVGFSILDPMHELQHSLIADRFVRVSCIRSRKAV